MISAELAGGDCLNAGCVPSKALLRCAKLIREVRKAASSIDNEYGIHFLLRHEEEEGGGDGDGDGDYGGVGGGDGESNENSATTGRREEGGNRRRRRRRRVDVEVGVDFPRIMERMRALRSKIAPVDGHARGISLGTQVYQGRGAFVSPGSIEVVEYGSAAGDPGNPTLSFGNAVVATGGRPRVPREIPGLVDSPHTTNVDLFNLASLPPRMVVLGSGVVAMEMAQAFATFGSRVTVVSSGRSGKLLSGAADEDAVRVLRRALEDDGVTFVVGATVREVATLRRPTGPTAETAATTGGVGGGDPTTLPLMRISLTTTTTTRGDDDDDDEGGGRGGMRQIDLECECLLVAMGRVANVESMGLENANVEYDPYDGILVDEFSRSISNPNVYAVGDCVAHVPRLTHGMFFCFPIYPPPPPPSHFVVVIVISSIPFFRHSAKMMHVRTTSFRVILFSVIYSPFLLLVLALLSFFWDENYDKTKSVGRNGEGRRSELAVRGDVEARFAGRSGGDVHRSRIRGR